LDGDDEGDAPVGAENAQQSAKRVPTLPGDDAVLDRKKDLAGNVGLDEFLINGAGPTRRQSNAVGRTICNQ
jgi:hypothetical protein